MRFFTEDVVEFELNDIAARKRFDEACRLNHAEYLKVRNRLPERFIEIYERTVHFDDALVLDIGIITEQPQLSTSPPSYIKMILMDYDNRRLVWEIIIDQIKEMSARWVVREGNSRIDCINYDEFQTADDGYISWEIDFVGGLNLKTIFKNIRVRELDETETEQFGSH